MILSSAKVVGNVGEQWKEICDNRVKKTVQQEKIQANAGKEIVPVDVVQSTNKFASLMENSGEKEVSN